MIVCKVCNHENEEGALFCGNCGEYLEWVGEKVKPAEPPVVEPPEEDEEAEWRGLIGRIKDAVGIGEAPEEALPPDPTPESADALTGGTLPEAPESSSGSSAPPDVGSKPSPGEPPDAEKTLVAAAASSPGAVPTQESSGDLTAGTAPTVTPSTAETPERHAPEEGLGPQEPSREKKVKQKRRRRRTTTTPIRHGDLICARCGEPNDPSRRYCRKCANSLTEAEVAKVSWWRRIFGSRRKPLPAGGRPTSTKEPEGGRRSRSVSVGAFSAMQKLRTVLGFLAFMGIVGLVALPSWRSFAFDLARGAFDRVRCLVTVCEDPVIPQKAVASSQFDGHPAKHAIDGKTNTFWSAANATADGRGEWLCLQFARRIHLKQIAFTAGQQDASGVLNRNQPRPSRLTLIFRNRPCSPGMPTRPPLSAEPDHAELIDSPDAQFKKFDRDRVLSVQIVVAGVYPGQKGHQLSLTEVEFFAD